MDYQKLDGQLARQVESAVPGEPKRVSVFVRARTPLPEEALRELERLRVPERDPSNTIFSMELSPEEVANLSDRSWVVSIRSSRKLRPLDA